MRKLLDRYKNWRARRQQLSLARWEQIRAKGQTRFVLHQALTWAVFMSAFHDVFKQIFEGGGNVSDFWFHLISYSLTGLFVGYFAWSSQEVKYKNALLNRHLQTPFDDRIKPR
jgi:hypothetical protein